MEKNAQMTNLSNSRMEALLKARVNFLERFEKIFIVSNNQNPENQNSKIRRRFLEPYRKFHDINESRNKKKKYPAKKTSY